MALMCLVFTYTHAQHDNNWHFGQWAGLTFTSGTAEAITNSALSTVECSASISDAEGNLLFYTNGRTIYNKENQVMETGLLGDHSSSQGAIIVPRPGMADRFFVFTADDAGGENGLHYTEVDMSLNEGLGDVVSLNNPLVTPVCEKVAAVFHANGNDIWVVTHQWGSDAFYSYLVTEDGVNTEPFISNAGIMIEGANNSGRYSGNMAFSPDGSRLAIVNYNIGSQLFDFDTATGTFSNPVTFFNGEAYGVAFSPSGNGLYLSTEGSLLQFQADAEIIPASEIEISGQVDRCALRLGPDGKIYVINTFLDEFVSVINNPDAEGTACNFMFSQVSLATKKTFSGLPAFMASPLYITDVAEAVDCDGTVAFSYTSTVTPESITWDFGDGNTSTLPNPVHTYAAAGTYTVKAIARKGIFAAYYNETVTVTVEQPVANTPADMQQCDTGGDGQGAWILSVQDAQILGAQSPDDFTVSYHLTEADAENNINPLADGYVNTVSPQQVFARVTANGSGCHAITSFLITVLPLPVIEMPDVYALCEGGAVTITAPAGFDAYEWSTGQSTQSITVDEPGQYTVTVWEGNSSLLCGASATVEVVLSSAPVITNVEIDDWTDNNNTITINTSGTGDYEFSIDGINYQSSNIFTGLEPGLYTVYARNACGMDTEEVVLLMYPKFFTPNGDGFNETWRIEFAFWEPGLTTHVFDRYGKLITSFRGSSPGWDGTFNGYWLPSTDYWFVVERRNGKVYKGHFSLIR